MTRRTWLFVGVVAVMVAIPLATIAWNEWKLASGEEIRLQVQPVDPLDFFRGEYVALQYPISNTAVVEWPNPKPGDTVYMTLRKQGDHWRGGSASGIKPTNGETFIRGRIESTGIDTHQIEYGIETFFVEEGQARRYEEAMFDRRLYADVVIDDDGGARLKDLVIRSQ
jgi:uncharacterized membrane-anchored protein